MKPVIIIAGPTAVGKTGLSVKLAKKLNGEIISADSMQVYKHMDIGTAKISNDEMQGIKHYLINELEPDDEFNVTIFQRLAKSYIEDIQKRNLVPLIVGGTGFYIQAVLYDIDFTEHSEESDEYNGEYRKYLYEILKSKGKETLFNMLRAVDPDYSDIIHMNNSVKVVRALEYNHLTGRKMSEHNEEQQRKESPYDFLYFVLTDKREDIYTRINTRVDKMFKDGLIDEVKSLVSMGYGKHNISMLGLGYKEVIDYLDGKITLDEAIELIKKGTRHFARRQETWFKREKNVKYINIKNFENDEAIINYISDCYESLKLNNLCRGENE